MGSEFVLVKVDRVQKLTDKAALCVLGENEVWVPLSQVENPEELEEGFEDVEISVAEWFARKEGLD